MCWPGMSSSLLELSSDPEGLAVPRAYCRLSAQESLWVGLRRPNGAPRIEPGLDMCKASDIPAILYGPTTVSFEELYLCRRLKQNISYCLVFINCKMFLLICRLKQNISELFNLY